MTYNTVAQAWIFDPFDYFLFTAILRSILISRLKKYLAKKKSMKRLKNFIIKKSRTLKDYLAKKESMQQLNNFICKRSKIKILVNKINKKNSKYLLKLILLCLMKPSVDHLIWETSIYCRIFLVPISLDSMQNFIILLLFLNTDENDLTLSKSTFMLVTRIIIRSIVSFKKSKRRTYY